jgi:hypothetical protein
MTKGRDRVSGGVKYDDAKTRWDLFPSLPLAQLAQVYTFGARKYADRNWELGIRWGRVYAALQRHLNDFWAGENLDPETGLPHVIHAAWGCLALAEYLKTRPDRDDRPETRHDTRHPRAARANRNLRPRRKVRNRSSARPKRTS